MAGWKAQGVGGSSEIVCLRSGDLDRRNLWEVVGWRACAGSGGD